MQKGYNIKVYNLAGTFQAVLSPSIIMTGVSFSETINGGQGELVLKLKLPFNTTSIAYNNVIKVFESDAENAPRQIYTGIVGNIRRVNENSSEYIEIRVLGIASALSLFYYYSGAYAFNASASQDTTMKAIIDYFSTKYPGLLSYSGTSVEAGSSVNLAFSYDKCLDALKKTADTSPEWWWSIDNTGVLQYHPITGSIYATTHKVKVGVEVDQVTVEENGEKIVNKYMLKYNGGTYTQTDATSTTDNGLRELYSDESSSINNVGTATIKGDAYISANKNSKRKITIEINSKYDIESVRVGHFITVQNLEYSISNLQIRKLDYNMDRIKVELEESTSLAKEIFT